VAGLDAKRNQSSKSNGKVEVSKLIRKTRQARRALCGPCGRTASAEKIRIVMEGIRAEASFRLMIR